MENDPAKPARPALEAGEVLIKMESVGICGSDVRIYGKVAGGPPVW